MFMTFFCFAFIKIQMILACKPSTSLTLLFYVWVCAGSPQFAAVVILIAYSDPVLILIEGSNGVCICKFDAWIFEIQPSFALEYRMSWIIDTWIYKNKCGYGLFLLLLFSIQMQHSRTTTHFFTLKILCYLNAFCWRWKECARKW